MRYTFTTLLAVLPLSEALFREDGLGKLPALGWNSWNAFNCDIDESKFLTAAEKIVSLGLKDAGYEYVNIDDCWQVKDRRENGRLIPDTAKFPNGINGTAQTVHDMGLKLGIYSSAGTLTCAGYQASIDYEEVDAETWAEWGVDYLKYDNCNIPTKYKDECSFCVPEKVALKNGTCVDQTGQCPLNYDWTKSNTHLRFSRMRDALLAQDRPILYSLCEWGTADVESWGADVGASWRSTDDINVRWDRITDIWNANSFYMNNVDFFGHPDADMLEVGNGDLTFEQGRTHFAIWAIMKSPLLIGTALDSLSQENVDVLKNKELLAFNQDNNYAAAAAPYKWGTNPDWTFDWLHPAEMWSGRYSNGVLVLNFNPSGSTQRRSIMYSDVPQLKKGGKYRVIDVWTGVDHGCLGSFYKDVNAYDSMVYVLQDTCGDAFVGEEAKVKERQELRETQREVLEDAPHEFGGRWAA